MIRRQMLSIGLRLAAWIICAAIVVMTLGPVSVRPHTPVSANAERFVAYLVLGLCFVLAYPRHVYLVGVALVIAAGGLEWAQNFVPGRDGRLEDFLFKAAGVIAGLIVVRFVQLAIGGSRRR
jgi:VanZ family protein